MEKGLLHIYCGDGKGKTTAAVGLAIRACGAGIPVLMAQFLKDGTSSELNILRTLAGFTVLPAPDRIKFTFQMNESEREAAARQCAQTLSLAFSRVREQPFGLLVLDEALGAINAGLLEETALTQALCSRPRGLETVLTGRGPSADLVAMADYVTEMKKEKHPFTSGIRARRGVEF